MSSTWFEPLDCQRTCLGCGLSWCADVTVSPGEADGLCESCWAAEDPEGDAA